MSGTEPRRGFKGYLWFLGACIVLPLIWVRSLRFARENGKKDPQAHRRMAGAIVLSLVLFGLGVYTLHGFVVQKDGNLVLDNPVGGFVALTDAAEGTYGNLDARLAAAVGEAEYQAQTEAVRTADATLERLETRLAEARQAGETERAAGFEANINATRADRAKAAAAAADLEPNHALYGRLKPHVESGKGEVGLLPTKHFPSDGRIRAEVQAAKAQGIDYEDEMAEKVDSALALKNKSLADMYRFLVLWVYPGLVGLLFAPLVWAQGRLLDRNFRESDTVGYKRYPHVAAAWTLILGAFGWPAIFFAAWAFKDINTRAAEGQINL